MTATEVFDHDIQRDVRWLQSHADQQGRIFVYTRDKRDALIAEGQRQAIEGFCWRWNVGRRAWEFQVIA